MINERKRAGVDLRRSYNILLQFGLIVALLFIIGLVKINLYSEPPQALAIEEQEEVVMEDVIQTKQIETPPPPPRPPVPVEVPNDEIIEDEILDLDAELDLDGPLDLPPPPPPVLAVPGDPLPFPGLLGFHLPGPPPPVPPSPDCWVGPAPPLPPSEDRRCDRARRTVRSTEVARKWLVSWSLSRVRAGVPLITEMTSPGCRRLTVPHRSNW